MFSFNFVNYATTAVKIIKLFTTAFYGGKKLQNCCTDFVQNSVISWLKKLKITPTFGKQVFIFDNTSESTKVLSCLS